MSPSPDPSVLEAGQQLLLISLAPSAVVTTIEGSKIFGWVDTRGVTSSGGLVGASYAGTLMRQPVDGSVTG